MNDSTPGDRGAPTPGRRVARPPEDATATQRVVVGDDSRVREVRGTRDARASGGDGAGVGRASQDPAYARADTVERPAVRLDDHDRGDVEPPAADEASGSTAPQKPVGEALGGFFAGMLYVLVLPVLWWVLSDPDSPADLLSADLVFFLPAILVPIGLAIAPRTRRFGRYMLLGVGLSGVVVVGVAALVLAFLIFTGR